MSSSRLFNVFVIVALAGVAAFAIRLALATNQVVAGPASGASGRPDSGEQAAGENVASDTRYYRSPPDECFDVPLSELKGCRQAVRTQVGSNALFVPGYRTPPDECFDVPLSEAAGCHSQAPSGAGQVRRSRMPPDPCFDVPLSEKCDG